MSTGTTIQDQLLRKLQNKEYRDAFVAAGISNTIAAQLFCLREQRGWTQRQLAEAVGMAQARISKLEDPAYDQHSITTLKRLAAALGVGLSVRFVSLAELARLATDADPLMSTGEPNAG